ncbi:MAG: adenylate/guanylate cyclase domain-containing protein [Nitriliruptorales bacterium]|nr:adenylate/guanylate cyclase domain-containing protein [Nitriliruptorales bacterium]
MTEQDQTRRMRAVDMTGTLPTFVRDALTTTELKAVSGDDEAADLETVEALMDLGLDKDEAEEAVRDGRVPLVLARRILDRTGRYTTEQLARKAEVDPDLLLELRATAGLTVPELWTRDDLAWARHTARLTEILSAEAITRALRGRATAVAAIVRSDLGLVRDELILPMRRAGADDLTVAIALAEMTKEFERVSVDLLTDLYRAHLLHQLGSEITSMAARSDETPIEIAVGFVDVVGYTALSSRVDPSGLDAVLDAFERRTVEVVSRHPEAAIVKYLGDAVMMVAPSAARLVPAMLELTTPVPELEDAPLSGGMSYGATLVREGDYFGPAVNLAARLTDLARPWKMLVDEELEAELMDDYKVQPIRPVHVRGLGKRQPLTVLGTK